MTCRVPGQLDCHQPHDSLVTSYLRAVFLDSQRSKQCMPWCNHADTVQCDASCHLHLHYW